MSIKGSSRISKVAKAGSMKIGEPKGETIDLWIEYHSHL